MVWYYLSRHWYTTTLQNQLHLPPDSVAIVLISIVRLVMFAVIYDEYLSSKEHFLFEAWMHCHTKLLYHHLLYEQYPWGVI